MRRLEWLSAILLACSMAACGGDGGGGGGGGTAAGCTRICAAAPDACRSSCTSQCGSIPTTCTSQWNALADCVGAQPVTCSASGGITVPASCNGQFFAAAACQLAGLDGGVIDGGADGGTDGRTDGGADSAADVRTDGGTTDVRTDVAVDAGPPSPAGATCTMPDPAGGMDPACGESLVCIPTGSTPICTTQCENAMTQAEERSMCGGTGSTCLTQGDGAQANSICTASCRPTAMTAATGACRTGFVCTGWWYTHTGATPDSPGCFPFCSTNADCGMGAAGSVCNARRGNCGTAGPDMTRLPDGSPCNPMMTVMVPGSMTPQNVQCRGICFGVSSTDRSQGICGSFINTRVATGCPDDPDNVQPLARTGADNLAICIFRGCMTNADCRSPHICRYDEQMGMPVTDGSTFCNYPTAAQRTGIPAMGTDGGSPTDASAGPG